MRTSVRTGLRFAFSMSTVTTWLPRSRNEISAMSRAHSHTGENTLSTRVPVIGLFSSFSRSVTANAAAVAKSNARTISVCGTRRTIAVRKTDICERRCLSRVDP